MNTNVRKIIVEGVEYYNKSTLSKLGLSDLEIKQYFNLQYKKWTDETGMINHLVKVEDFNNYLKFKKSNPKMFVEKTLVKFKR
ncbi:MAG: hypothetical protein EKK61_05760 [Rickettsiales bacterium]|nr:MAG: hypothetical protein EKK61_05760 [Rickettsiales bacterium]